MWAGLTACMGVSKTFAAQMKRHMFFSHLLTFSASCRVFFESKRNKVQAGFKMFQASDGIPLRSSSRQDFDP